jgi:hypothetical protein
MRLGADVPARKLAATDSEWPEDGRPVVVHSSGRAPQTTGASSVFHIHKRVVPPRDAEDIEGPPPERRRGYQPSPWAAFYDAMRPEVGKRVTRLEAVRFAAWARAHGKCVTRRNMGDGMFGVWIKE